jgi:hypothetical protein
VDEAQRADPDAGAAHLGLAHHVEKFTFTFAQPPLFDERTRIRERGVLSAGREMKVRFHFLHGTEFVFAETWAANRRWRA